MSNSHLSGIPASGKVQKASAIPERADDLVHATRVGFFGARNVDVMLVSAVERTAGAHCHQAANLLQDYFLCIEMYRQAEDVQTAQSALQDLGDSEANLRRFLFQCQNLTYTHGGVP